MCVIINFYYGCRRLHCRNNGITCQFPRSAQPCRQEDMCGACLCFGQRFSSGTFQSLHPGKGHKIDIRHQITFTIGNKLTSIMKQPKLLDSHAQTRKHHREKPQRPICHQCSHFIYLFLVAKTTATVRILFPPAVGVEDCLGALGLVEPGPLIKLPRGTPESLFSFQYPNLCNCKACLACSRFPQQHR